MVIRKPLPGMEFSTGFETKGIHLKKDAADLEDAILGETGRVVASPGFVWQGPMSFGTYEKTLGFLMWLRSLPDEIGAAPFAMEGNLLDKGSVLCLRRHNIAGTLCLYMDNDYKGPWSQNNGYMKIVTPLISSHLQISVSSKECIQLDLQRRTIKDIAVGQRIRLARYTSEKHRKHDGELFRSWYSRNRGDVVFIYADQLPIRKDSRAKRRVYDAYDDKFMESGCSNIEPHGEFVPPGNLDYAKDIVRSCAASYHDLICSILETHTLASRRDHASLSEEQFKALSELTRW